MDSKKDIVKGLVKRSNKNIIKTNEQINQRTNTYTFSIYHIPQRYFKVTKTPRTKPNVIQKIYEINPPFLFIILTILSSF